MVSEDEASTEALLDEEVEDELPVQAAPRRKPARRHDVQVGPKRKPGRPKKIRHDSDPLVAIDGFGEPLRCKTAPGWTACFVSEDDALSLAWRPWEVAKWGDPRVIEYRGSKQGEKGQVIKWKDLTIYLIRTRDLPRVKAADPKRQAFEQQRQKLFLQAEQSGQYDMFAMPGEARPRAIPDATRGFVNVHRMG